MNREQGPLYWLLVSNKEKPANRKLLREPSVWFFLVGSAIWGLACIWIVSDYSSRQEADSILIKVVKFVGIASAAALPTVVLRVRESEKGENKFSFEDLCLTAVTGFCLTIFLAMPLWWILVVLRYLLGFHGFLGIPMP